MSHLGSLNPYDRHKLIVNQYVLNRPGRTKLLKRDESRDKRDIDVIRENHKFLWEDDDIEEDLSWEQRLAKKYYDKLFKEYCICDLARYKENKVALRWRTENEVISGKGQFTCGSKICSEKEELRSWEVNFAYMEQSEKKNALVKVRLCLDCSYKLNYRSKKREIKRMQKVSKKKRLESPKSSTSIEETNSIAECNKEYEDKLDNEKEAETESQEVEECPDKDVWVQQIDKEKSTREDEFEKYLEDLLF